jgi:formylglycine-generating enzyme required for sulfatase activity
MLYPPPPGQGVKILDFNVRWVPPGRFTMGNSMDSSLNEREHEVVFNRGFFISETECTQSQWESVMGTRPSFFKGTELPVEQVNWEEAVEFCRKLTEKHREQGKVPKGWEWRLPTESEWEYAARAGTTGARHGELDLIAWHPKNSGFTTHPVGKKQANAWGLHDMIGNVWEWCSDWYIDSYPTGIVVHPKGPSEGKARVFRGGTYRSDNNYKLESAHRSGIAPEVRAQDIGFRLVLDQVSRP